MEQWLAWLVDLNRSHHTGFALLTVATMIGFGGLIAGVIELILAVVGITADKPEIPGDR